MKTQRPVYVVDGARTPFLRARKKPGPFTASDLAFLAGRSLLRRQPFKPAELDEVILGCVIPRPDEANIGRVVSLRLGCGKKVPAWTVQRNCASGMQALDCAFQNITSGRSNLILAGGTESMSHAPVLIGPALLECLAAWRAARDAKGRLKVLLRLRPRHLKPVFGLLMGLTDPIVGVSMGQTAEILSHRFSLTREAMDAYSLESHRRLARAMDQGYMEEIETIYDAQGNFYDQDEGLRRDTDISKLAKLRPSFDKGTGKVTPGNSAQITDGAAVLILASEEAVEKYRLPVMGEILDCRWAGVDPAQMGLGPVHAVARLLAENRLEPARIDYWEINEAFAAQVLACLEAWKDGKYCREELGLEKVFGTIDPARLNVDGGGISLGHPLGASGARIVLHLLHVLRRTDTLTGMATLCIGGGQGGAMLVKKI